MDEVIPHILFVEDDQTLGFVTRDNLELHGFEVTHVADGQVALNLLPELHFDLALLDVMLPQINGFELAQHIRQNDADVPILFLTAKSLKEDRLKGFGLGADDYITKPFSIEELIFRINVFLKRPRVLSGHTDHTVYSLGRYSFDYQNLQLCSEAGDKVLTQKEADLLLYLFRYQNQVCKRSDILEQIWGEDDYFMGRSLDVFISRLRKYLASDHTLQIQNIHGVGFKLNTSA